VQSSVGLRATAKRAVALLPLLLACGLVAGCGPSTGSAAAVSNVLNCGRVVDPLGYRNGPLTVNRAIGLLTEMQLAGGAASIPRGRPSGTETSTLDLMATELMGYSGSKLSDDAESFAQAELNYNPDGPVATSYARPLDRDIAALERDCPDGMKLGRQWRSAAGLAAGGRRRRDRVDGR
jgi:hypothetical protein